MTREGEGAILEVKVSGREKEPFGPEEEEGQRSKAAHPPTHPRSSSVSREASGSTLSLLSR